MTETVVAAPTSCEHFQRVASAWLRSGEMTRTKHLLSPLEELAGFNYGFIYLLDVRTEALALQGDRPAFKIGFSEHPARRLRELRPSYGEVRLRACFVGEAQRERELHRRFAHLRIERELFLPSNAIVAAFEEARSKVRHRLRSLHLCMPECPQLVSGIDLRMLHAWLRR